MKRNKTFNIDEDKLKDIIAESIKKVLGDYSTNEGYDYEKMKSDNAIYAEEEGFQRGQYFCRSNKMEPVVLKYLADPFFKVIDAEWHHTGKRYNKTSYYKWSKPEYRQIYQANKAKIDDLVLQYNSRIEELGSEPSTGLTAKSEYWCAWNDIEASYFKPMVNAVKSIFGVS